MSTTGGGRVTELTARPLINLFYPQLSGLVQPLAGEMAGRRSVLEAVPFFTGYGVETGLLIDILEQFGLRSIAQTDLEVRVHRNQTLLSLSKMAFAIVQVVIKRLGETKRLELLEDVNTSMKLIHYSPSELFLEVQEVRENERPPINTIADYRSGRQRDVVVGVLEPKPASLNARIRMTKAPTRMTVRTAMAHPMPAVAATMSRQPTRSSPAFLRIAAVDRVHPLHGLAVSRHPARIAKEQVSVLARRPVHITVV